MFGDGFSYYGILVAVAAAAVSTFGLVSMTLLGDWGRRNSPYFSAFAVGFLLVSVFFHLIPEALENCRPGFEAIGWVGIGFGVMGVVGFALRTSTRRSEAGKNLAFGFASILALGTHSLLDGFIYVTSFQDIVSGWLATFALLLHEYPEGVIAFFLLRESGMGRYAAGFWAFVAASLTTIIGAVIMAFLLQNAIQPSFGLMMGLTAGGLLYILLFHLGPHASFTPHRRGYVVASLGVLVALAAVLASHFSVLR